MASKPSLNPSVPVGRRLYELLEQPQEPFFMETYLNQNGFSGRIIRPRSSLFCWPLNAAGKRLRKFGSHGGIRRSKGAGFLKHVLVKLVYRKTVRKSLHLDRKTTASKTSSIFDLFWEESKYQLRTVSVVDMQHSYESPLFDKQNECLLLSCMDVPRKSSITLKEIYEKAMRHKNLKFSNRRLLFDCLRQAEEGIMNLHGCLDSLMFEESVNELILSWEGEKGKMNNLTQIVVSETPRFREEWNQFKPEAREIGLGLEAAIFDELKEEAILVMMNSKFL